MLSFYMGKNAPQVCRRITQVSTETSTPPFPRKTQKPNRMSLDGTDRLGDPAPLADHAATLFASLLAWIETQFRPMGKGDESPELAAHLMAAIQGMVKLDLAALRRAFDGN